MISSYLVLYMHNYSFTGVALSASSASGHCVKNRATEWRCSNLAMFWPKHDLVTVSDMVYIGIQTWKASLTPCRTTKGHEILLHLRCRILPAIQNEPTRHLVPGMKLGSRLLTAHLLLEVLIYQRVAMESICLSRDCHLLRYLISSQHGSTFWARPR
jgi:hypothetical protein